MLFISFINDFRTIFNNISTKTSRMSYPRLSIDEKYKTNKFNTFPTIIFYHYYVLPVWLIIFTLMYLIELPIASSWILNGFFLSFQFLNTAWSVARFLLLGCGIVFEHSKLRWQAREYENVYLCIIQDPRQKQMTITNWKN